jgi:hypothetical protein
VPTPDQQAKVQALASVVFTMADDYETDLARIGWSKASLWEAILQSSALTAHLWGGPQ